MEHRWTLEEYQSVQHDLRVACWIAVYGSKEPEDKNEFDRAFNIVWKACEHAGDQLHEDLRAFRIPLSKYREGWMKIVDTYKTVRFMTRLDSKIGELAKFQEENPMLTANWKGEQPTFEFSPSSKKEEPFL